MSSPGAIRSMEETAATHFALRVLSLQGSLKEDYKGYLSSIGLAVSFFADIFKDDYKNSI